MSEEKASNWRFDDVRVEPSNFKLYKNENEVSLEPKTFRLLLFLIENQARLVEKTEILDVVWKDAFVTENALTREIAKLRNCLGDDPKSPKYIQTVHTKGYRFIAEVEEVPTSWTNPLNETPIKSTEATGTRSNQRKWAVYGLLGLVLAVGLGWSLLAYLGKADSPIVLKTTQITTWGGLDFYPTISRDGNTIAFSSDRSGAFEIYIKQLVTGARETQLTFDGTDSLEPAFSPNADLIAFYSQKRGGIWVVPITGGTPRQITDFGSRPAWSPDGKTIAFQTDPMTSTDFNAANAQPPSVIWLVPATGGEPRRLTQPNQPAGGHGAPSFSPDGKRIAFAVSSFGKFAVWSMAIDGSESHELNTDGRSASDPIYSPDGRSIYFVMDRGSSIERVAVNTDGEAVGKPKNVFNTSGSRVRQLAIAENGLRLVCSSLSTSSDIVSIPIDKSGATETDKLVRLTNDKNTRNTFPVFSPDGTKMVYAKYTVGSAFGLWLMDTDGSNKIQLAENGAWPTWFPDGKRLGYIDKPDDKNIYTSITTEGLKKTEILTLDIDAVYTLLSPDAQKIAFHSTSGGAPNIWIQELKGGPPVQITFDKEFMGYPIWSPDGHWIAAEVRRGEDSEVAIVPAAGGEATQLTSDKGQSWVFGWSPDSDKILFAGQRKGIWNVYWVSRSTREVKQVTQFDKLNVYVRYPAWSPRNDRIAFEYGETTGNIWTIDLK